ncbi:MAG: hypothetical protein QOE68_2006, partial [Thermoanaerobaculia bacterium]|nr:hypothetical protein [Thermoanaerobaculia bacterium]
DPALAIANVRNWLRAESGRSDLPGPYSLNDRYAVFRSEVGGVCSRIALKPDEMTFVDYCQAVAAWLADEKILVAERTKDPG